MEKNNTHGLRRTQLPQSIFSDVMDTRMNSRGGILPANWHLPYSDTVLFDDNHTALQNELFDGWKIGE